MADVPGFYLWNLLLPIKDPSLAGQQDDTLPFDTTTTEPTLRRCFPNIVIPENPKVGDTAYVEEADQNVSQEKPRSAPVMDMMMSFESVFRKALTAE